MYHSGHAKALYSDIGASIDLERDEDIALFMFMLLLTQA